MSEDKNLSPFVQAVIAVCGFLVVNLGLVYFLLDAKIEPINKQVNNHIPTQLEKLEKIDKELKEDINKIDKKIDKLLILQQKK